MRNCIIKKAAEAGWANEKTMRLSQQLLELWRNLSSDMVRMLRTNNISYKSIEKSIKNLCEGEYNLYQIVKFDYRQ